MCLLFVIISALFIGCSWGQLGGEIFGKYKNEAQTRCGFDKSCVPVYLCREGGINVDGHLGNQKNKSPQFGYDLPYLGTFPPKSFGIGKTLRIEGLILPKLVLPGVTELFTIRLQSGQKFWPEPTIAFELKERAVTYTDDGVVNVEAWDQNFRQEKSLNLDIVREVCSYKVYVNKQLMIEIPKQADDKLMDTLYVNGDFRLMDVRLENFSPAVESQKSPFVFRDIGVIKEGVSFIVTGYILPNCERFSINLITADNSITLHVNPRLNSGAIVFNFCQNNIWHVPGELYRMLSSLREGSRFTIQILVTDNCYMIAINGQHVYEFQHHLPYASVTHINAEGDISNVDFRRTEVPNYPEGFRESDVQQI